jgi:hypothetical protein
MLNPRQILASAPCQDDIGAVKVYVRFTSKADISGRRPDEQPCGSLPTALNGSTAQVLPTPR